MTNVISKLRNYSLLAACSLSLVACGQNYSEDIKHEPLASLSPPSSVLGLLQSRMIDRSVLFSELILRYEDTEEVVTAARDAGTDVWETNFRLPSGRDFSIEITWYDTFDGYDDDVDGLTNLAEREAGSSPLEASVVPIDIDMSQK